MMQAGRLRHRLKLQQLEYVADSSGEIQDSYGEPVQDWVDVASIWGAIEPLSAREFIAAQSEQSKVTAKIIIRYRGNINAAMRVFHEAKGIYYNIEGILTDKESGLEYITLPVSEGVRTEPTS